MKTSLLLATISLGLVVQSAFAAEWLTGVYINQDENAMMDEVVFCTDGKAYAGMSPRDYQISTKDDGDYVVLNSNGTFTFKVSEDRATLTPADEFTSSWFTKSSLKLNPSKKDSCNW